MDGADVARVDVGGVEVGLPSRWGVSTGCRRCAMRRGGGSRWGLSRWGVEVGVVNGAAAHVARVEVGRGRGTRGRGGCRRGCVDVAVLPSSLSSCPLPSPPRRPAAPSSPSRAPPSLGCDGASTRWGLRGGHATGWSTWRGRRGGVANVGWPTWCGRRGGGRRGRPESTTTVATGRDGGGTVKEGWVTMFGLCCPS